MTTTQLTLYNGALRVLGERKLLTLSEDRKSRRLLDDAYNENAIDYTLEQGLWKFATRAVKLDADDTIEPEFGYRRVFAPPSDFVRTVAVCSDEYFNTPITSYSFEAEVWYSEIDPMYVKYVSTNNSYGSNLSAWPESFVRYFEHYLAAQVCEGLTQGASKLETIEKKMKKLLTDAKSKTAFEEGAKFPPIGSWASSRVRGFSNERGKRNRLIG